MEYRYQPFNNMPFYMNYPMQNLYLTEMEYERDMDRMKELYPRDIKRILDLVEEACDKMEYEGSLMFDEYPDRFMMEQITDRIYEKMRDMDNQVESQQWNDTREDLKKLIGVLLTHEMYRRRCRHRRCNRWW